MTTVTITYDHIDRGVQGQCDTCALAIGIREAFPDLPPDKIVHVLGGQVQIDKWKYPLPDAAVLFQGDFDADKREVGPLTFTLPANKDGSPWVAVSA